MNNRSIFREKKLDMSSRQLITGIFLVLLAVVFSIGLMFASIELPDLMQNALYDTVPALSGDSHADSFAVTRTEIFMRHYHLRLIGYICFILMVLIIIGGFLFGKRGLASAGALLMFLPVFAQFAGVMFFLAGLGILNIIWLPVLDISFDAGRLGDVVYLPYRLLRALFTRIGGIDIHLPLVYACIGIGLLLFTLGTFTWLSARYRKRDMADFWIYKISRHPQYLGWIIWSYGMLLALMRIKYPKRSWGIASALPWMLSAMIIIGVALMEERKMKHLMGEKYEKYRKATPFLFPLPGFIGDIFTIPARLLFRKPLPDRKGEIAVVCLVYTAILIALSPLSWKYSRPRRFTLSEEARTQETRTGKLIRELQINPNPRSKFWIIEELSHMGSAVVDPLLPLLKHPDPEVRSNTARALEKIKDPRSIPGFIDLLRDENAGIRMQAVDVLGRFGAREAEAALTPLLDDSDDAVRVAAVRALSRLGSMTGLAPAMALLDHRDWWTRKAAAESLGLLGSEEAVDALVERYPDKDVRVRRAVVVALLEIGSPRSAPSLKQAVRDEDWEVRLYAQEALKKIGRNPE